MNVFYLPFSIKESNLKFVFPLLLSLVENWKIRSGKKSEHARIGGRHSSSEVKDRIAVLIKKFDTGFIQRAEG